MIFAEQIKHIYNNFMDSTQNIKDKKHSSTAKVFCIFAIILFVLAIVWFVISTILTAKKYEQLVNSGSDDNVIANTLSNLWYSLVKIVNIGDGKIKITFSVFSIVVLSISSLAIILGIVSIILLARAQIFITKKTHKIKTKKEKNTDRKESDKPTKESTSVKDNNKALTPLEIMRQRRTSQQ